MTDRPEAHEAMRQVHEAIYRYGSANRHWVVTGEAAGEIEAAFLSALAAVQAYGQACAGGERDPIVIGPPTPLTIRGGNR